MILSALFEVMDILNSLASYFGFSAYFAVMLNFPTRSTANVKSLPKVTASDIGVPSMKYVTVPIAIGLPFALTVGLIDICFPYFVEIPVSALISVAIFKTVTVIILVEDKYF